MESTKFDDIFSQLINLWQKTVGYGNYDIRVAQHLRKSVNNGNYVRIKFKCLKKTEEHYFIVIANFQQLPFCTVCTNGNILLTQITMALYRDDVYFC